MSANGTVQGDPEEEHRDREPSLNQSTESNSSSFISNNSKTSNNNSIKSSKSLPKGVRVLSNPKKPDRQGTKARPSAPVHITVLQERGGRDESLTSLKTLDSENVSNNANNATAARNNARGQTFQKENTKESRVAEAVHEFSNPALTLTSHSSQYLHPFFSLPEPVRVKIFKYFTHTERLLAQFVCRRFRNDIRLRAGLRTKVTEETATGIAFLRDVLVTSIIVGKYDRPISPPSRLIYNPENVFELIFEEPICVQHLDAFLNRCRKIKWFIIRTSVVDTPAFPSNVKSPFTNYEWRSLEVIHKYPIPQPSLKELILCIPGMHCLRTVNRSLALMNTPALERFSLMVNHPIAFEETTAVHFAVLNYLKNCPNASYVIICTEQRASTVRYANRISNIQSLERELNQYVEKLHLKHLVLTEPAVAFETWNIVLHNQNALQVLQVLHMTIWPLLRDIIMINAKTLVKVALHAILWDKYGKHSPIDLTVFNRSINLKELYICIASAADVTNKENKAHADFINFQKLPKSLEILALKNCSVNVRDFLSIRNLSQLKSLGIVSLGSSDSSSIGSRTLKKLIHFRALDELFISGLVSSDKADGEELKSTINLMKGRVKDKRRVKNTFQCHPGVGTNRWSINRSGNIIFTLFSNWGFITY